MSYPSQWTTSGLGQHSTSISAQGDILQNAAIFNPFNPNTPLRQPIQMQIPTNQIHPGQNSAAYCPTAPGGYPFVYPALMAALAAQSSAIQSRQNSLYSVPQAAPHTSSAAAAVATAFRGTALLSPTNFQTANSQPAQQPIHPLQYFPAPNGLPLASAFPGAPLAPSFSHTPPFTQPHTGTLPVPQFRGFDSLKHFGALPQTVNFKRNKSMTTSKTNLYIFGLSESDTDDSVRALVEDVVCPKSCKAMLLNGKCKGSGFIDCASEEDAVKALNHLAEMAKNGGRKLNVKYALENEKDLLNVYVKNLPKTGFTKETLENLFRPFGQVTSVKLLEIDGVHTGIGFVRFASADQAQRAVESMNEQRFVLSGGDVGSGDSLNDSNSDGAKPICCKLADKADPKRRGTQTVVATCGHNTSASYIGPSRAKFHHPGRHHQQTLHQQLIPCDLNLPNHQPTAAHTLPNHQVPQGFICQPGYGQASNPAASGYPSTRPPTTTDSHEPPRSTSNGLLEMPPSSLQPTEQFLPPMNSHSPAAAVATGGGGGMDSRYFPAHLVASQMSVANNAAMLQYSAAVATSPFSRPAHPLPLPAYSNSSYAPSVYNAGHYTVPNGQPMHACGNPPNPNDLLVEQLQSLSLAARQTQQLYSDWSAAGGFQVPSVGTSNAIAAAATANTSTAATVTYQHYATNENPADFVTGVSASGFVQMPTQLAEKSPDQQLNREKLLPAKEDGRSERSDSIGNISSEKLNAIQSSP